MSAPTENPETVRLAQAAAWRFRLTENPLETALEFEAWLADPANMAAWEQVSSIWNYLGENANEPELLAARQYALRDANRPRTLQKTRSSWINALTVVAATVLLCTVIWGAIEWLQRPDDYRALLGERRVVTLLDGSKISLDSDSEVTVRYTNHSRELHLLYGQARFDVAHDVTRPFSVLAGNQKVIATGTSFNIDMTEQKVLVTLIEGHVVVVDQDTNRNHRLSAPLLRPRLVELKAGQQLAATPMLPPEVAPVNLQRVTSWINGQIVADNEPLSSLVRRLNRYSSVQVSVTDPKIAAMRISGVFDTGDVYGFVDVVAHYLPVHATTEATGTIVLEGEPKKGASKN
jgi:transmembrane sensor